MKLVAQSAETRAERARRGQRFVRNELAPSVIGAIMKRRLELLRKVVHNGRGASF